MNVLVFEEDRIFRKKMKETIESFEIGLNVIESCTLEEAKTILNMVSIDMFIVDLETKKKCNLDCIDEHLNPHNTIIIATSLSDDDAKKLIEMEVFDVMYKPIDLNTFRVKINTLSRIVRRRKEFIDDSIMFELDIMRYIKILDKDVLNND